MKVAIVCPYDPRPPPGGDPRGQRGGVEEALDRCARGLAERGHDVTLVCSAEQASEQVDADGVRMVRLARRAIVFRNPIAAFASAIPDDADVLHVPATYPLVSDILPWREARRRAVVVDYHFDVHGTGPLMRAAAAVHGATLAHGVAHATRVLCKSLDYARHSRTLRRVASEKLDWVPNGVDLDEFRPVGARGEDILCVGRLVPYKGVDTLLRAMPRVHDQAGARLTLVGDGPEAARLQRLARELDAPVDFRGRVARDELPALYSAHRVTVLPSANSQEAFGIALLESMACGTPVVASELPGVREVARMAGLTAPPGDAGALAETIVRAWREPDAFGAPSEIRARVAAAFAWPRVIERLEAAYDRALAAAPARRLPGATRSRAPVGGSG